MRHGGWVMRIVQSLLIAAIIGLLFCSYSDAAVKKTQKPAPTTKGVQHKMKTYYLGRFAIDLPDEFKLENQSQKLRYAEISDFKWMERDREKERNALWAQKIAEIKKLKLPKGKDKIILEEVDFPKVGRWAKGVLYYGNYISPRTLYWTVLFDHGDTGIWLQIDGIKRDQLADHLTNILKHYNYNSNDLTKDSFCLNYGRIELPYLEQESTYARFAGPMGMKLEIEMRQIHKEPESGGIISRTVAAMAGGFAAGINIEKIRSRKRTLAALPGEEEILSGVEGDNHNLGFDWEYLGTVESGEKPWIQITLDTKPDNKDEKIVVWDQILESFRPVLKR